MEGDELKEKAIFGDETSIIADEINAATATGFLDDEEMKLMRTFQDQLSNIRSVESQMDIDLSKRKKELQKKMIFLAHSSGSKNGAGVKAVISEIMIQDQNVYQAYSENQEEKSSIIDKITNFGKKAQSGGATEFGSNIDYRRKKGDDIWDR